MRHPETKTTLNEQTRPGLDKAQYPSGAFAKSGQHLQKLAIDESRHTTPTRLQGVRPRLHCITVPTHRSIRRNRRSILRIMNLAQEHGVDFLLFLCSGEAKKEDVAVLAAKFVGLNWAAIDGPFTSEAMYEFQTTESFIAYSKTYDLAQKRNLALLLARLMGWRKLFLLDDDIDLCAEDLARAADLLETKATAVGFNVRQFPDLSVAVYASQWAGAPIDSFIGGGALGIRTDSPEISFFPHIYCEDWLFLLLHCLIEDDNLTWAGSLRQRRYNPFKNTQRAQSQEAGDLLAESLLRLAMTMKTDRLLPKDFKAILHQIKVCADKDFWEHEINERILFIRRTQDKIRLRKMPNRNKRRALRSLDTSLATLTGTKGVRGLRGAELANWVQAWLQDIEIWNQLVNKLPRHTTFSSAIEHLGLSNEYIFKQGRLGYIAPAAASHADPPRTLPAELNGLPNIPRSPKVLLGLLSTYRLQQFSKIRSLDMRAVVENADLLRSDRPINEQVAKRVEQPQFTIAMLVANGESTGLISIAVQQIKQWTQGDGPIQLIIWVHGTNDHQQGEVDQYRDTLVSRLVSEIAGSNIYLRSEVLPAETSTIDQLIDNALQGTVFAYWKRMIEGDHQVYIVNSKNELLRKGTFWDFLQQRHTVPGQPLGTYLVEAQQSGANSKGPLLGPDDDEQAINQARLNMLHAHKKQWFPRLTLRKSPTAKLMQSMKRARLSWLELDDIGHSFRLHARRSNIKFRDVNMVRKVHIIPVNFEHSLASEAYMEAKKVLGQLGTINQDDKAIECLVVIYGTRDHTWSQLLHFRKELLRLIQEQCTWNDIVITSFICHPTKATSPNQAKVIAIAVAQYMHWLEDHSYLPTLHWHKV